MQDQKTGDSGMIPTDPGGTKEPATAGPKKSMLLAAAAVTGVIIACAIAFILLVQPPPGSHAAVPAAKGAHVPETLPLAQSAATAAPPSITPDTEPMPVSEQKPVDFVLDPGPQTDCGLTCRQLAPTITNTGDETAHTVCINLVVSNSNGDLIFLNGEPSIRQCVGDLAGNESRSEPIVINADCGFLASRCIGQTLILQTTATSDEHTVRFPDQMVAV
jgi:hypothetical protein